MIDEEVRRPWLGLVLAAFACGTAAAFLIHPADFDAGGGGGEAIVGTLLGFAFAALLALAGWREIASGSPSASGLPVALTILLVGLFTGLAALLVKDPQLRDVLVVPLAGATGTGVWAAILILYRRTLRQREEKRAPSRERSIAAGQVQDTVVSDNRVEGDVRVEPRQTQ